MDERRKALPQAELLTLIGNLQAYIHRETLPRFHATRHLEEQMEGETVRLLMDVAFRAPEANALYDCLCQLHGNAALIVAGIQYRKESQQRPPTLQQLMALSWGPWSSKILPITATSTLPLEPLWALSRSAYCSAEVPTSTWGLFTRRPSSLVNSKTLNRTQPSHQINAQTLAHTPKTPKPYPHRPPPRQKKISPKPLYNTRNPKTLTAPPFLKKSTLNPYAPTQNASLRGHDVSLALGIFEEEMSGLARNGV